MRAILFVFVLVGIGLAGGQAAAQPIVTRDPGAFADTLRETMAVSWLRCDQRLNNSCLQARCRRILKWR